MDFIFTFLLVRILISPPLEDAVLRTFPFVFILLFKDVIDSKKRIRIIMKKENVTFPGKIAIVSPGINSFYEYNLEVSEIEWVNPQKY